MIKKEIVGKFNDLLISINKIMRFIDYKIKLIDHKYPLENSVNKSKYYKQNGILIFRVEFYPNKLSVIFPEIFNDLDEFNKKTIFSIDYYLLRSGDIAVFNRELEIRIHEQFGLIESKEILNLHKIIDFNSLISEEYILLEKTMMSNLKWIIEYSIKLNSNKKQLLTSVIKKIKEMDKLN